MVLGSSTTSLGHCIWIFQFGKRHNSFNGILSLKFNSLSKLNSLKFTQFVCVLKICAYCWVSTVCLMSGGLWYFYSDTLYFEYDVVQVFRNSLGLKEKKTTTFRVLVKPGVLVRLFYLF